MGLFAVYRGLAAGFGNGANPAVALNTMAQQVVMDWRQGAVLDGRDIGTVVFPDADAKIFIDASDRERARRRYVELTDSGNEMGYDAVLADIVKRDQQDRERQAAPLKPAADAHLLDTTNLDIEAAFKAAVELIDAAMGRAGHAS